MNQLVQQLQEQGESKEQRSTTKALEREVAHYKRLVKELRRGNDDPEIAVVGGREVEESLSRPVSVVSHIQVDTINNEKCFIRIKSSNFLFSAEPHRTVPTTTGQAAAKDGRGWTTDRDQGTSQADHRERWKCSGVPLVMVP